MAGNVAGNCSGKIENGIFAAKALVAREYAADGEKKRAARNISYISPNPLCKDRSRCGRAANKSVLIDLLFGDL